MGKLEKDPVRVVFIDRLTVGSLLGVWARWGSPETVWYFEPTPSSCQYLLRVVRLFGLLSAEVRQVEHNIGQVRDGSGESGYIVALRSARKLCRRVREEQLLRQPLLGALGRSWEERKVVWHFERLAEDHWATPEAPPPGHPVRELGVHPADDRLQLDPDVKSLGRHRMTGALLPLAGPRAGACGAVHGGFALVRIASGTRLWCSGRGSGILGTSFSAAS